jgi:circadian clock protein KaiB
MRRKSCDHEQSPTVIDSREAFELALTETTNGMYVLRLYVSGMTPNSVRAIDNIRKLCTEHLEGRYDYDLEIIDIYQQPLVARAGQIVAAPTLVKELPLPLRKFIGDMSKTERILVRLDVTTIG